VQDAGKVTVSVGKDGTITASDSTGKHRVLARLLGCPARAARVTSAGGSARR
jgi:hypothetical protein